MGLLVYCVLAVISAVGAETGFGSSYLKNSKLCHQWACINAKLQLPDSLPPRDQYHRLLSTVLPPGGAGWQDVVGKTLDVCYGDKPRRYTNTCPGQAMLHCVVDQLIQNCPEAAWQKGDACAPLSTLAGFKYMFSQSRYNNLEQNLPKERRPPWFLKNYFNSKCCMLPDLFNTTTLSECGFTSLVFYHVHEPRHESLGSRNMLAKVATTTPSQGKDVLKVVALYNNTKEKPQETLQNTLKLTVELNESSLNLNPLDCCDLSSYIEPSFASDCGFELAWTGQERLLIRNVTETLTTTNAPTTPKPMVNDVKVVPLSCEQETCVFRHLNIITDSGSVDLGSFSKLLDNLTSVHPDWTKAKGRAITKCLTKPLVAYAHECEINNVLACIFDVLSENCPHAKKADPCKHSNTINDSVTCQISSSKLRPKNRRQFCAIPNLVNHEALLQCKLTSISKLEFVPDPPVTVKPERVRWWNKYSCKETTASTKCLLSKMGMVNKYGFMDYFKMKDHIRHFTTEPAWSSLTEIYLSTFTGTPLYADQCSSPRKLLNVLDAMLTTCPISKRKHSLECNRMFTDMMSSVPVNTKIRLNQQKLDQIINRIRHVFLPLIPRYLPSHNSNSTRFDPTLRSSKYMFKPRTKIVKKPLYDFGILNSKGVPPVKIIDVKPPTVEERQPLVLLPVYLRIQGRVQANNGAVRSEPSHNEEAVALSTTTKTVQMAKP